MSVDQRRPAITPKGARGRRVRRGLVAAAVAPLLLGAVSAPAQAADVGADHTPKPQAGPGSLDRTFGGDGIVSTAVGDGSSSFARGVAVQADGKVVAVGVAAVLIESTNPSFPEPYSVSHFSLTRYLEGGALDTSFGDGGILVLGLAPGADDPGSEVQSNAQDVAVQPDGKIVAVGSLNNRFAPPEDPFSGTFSAVVRLNPDGSLDPSFDGDGVALTNVSPGTDISTAVALQTDGRIVAAGVSNGSTSTVIRYNADGSLDTTFDGDGIALTPEFVQANGVAVQTDGRILTANFSAFSNGNFGVARYNADGSPDTSFGTAGNGTTITDFGNNDRAYDVALQTDGKVVVVGHTDNGGALSQFAVARYTTSGALDTSFGLNGRQTNTIDGLPQGEAFAVAIQANGKILAAGRSGPSPNNDFALARYNTNGTLDTSFGGDGTVRNDLDNDSDSGRDVALYPDGRIVMAGSGGVDGQSTFGLTRNLGDPVLSVVCPSQDIANVIYGSEGADNIVGSSGNDLIYGLGGSDTIDAGRGDDCIYAGTGKDSIDAARGRDAIHLAAGDAKTGAVEKIKGGTGMDSIVLGADLAPEDVTGTPPTFSVNDPATGGTFQVSQVENVVDD